MTVIFPRRKNLLGPIMQQTSNGGFVKSMSKEKKPTPPTTPAVIPAPTSPHVEAPKS